MQLTMQDVVRLFEVPERRVYRWIQEETLPAEIVNSQYRFDRTELLEWATVRKISFSPAIFHEVNGDAVDEVSLTEALRCGGVTHLAAGDSQPDLRTVLQVVLDGMPLPGDAVRADLLGLLLAREAVGSTAVGDGIVLPHARYPVVTSTTRTAVCLCFLSEPIRFDSPDPQPIDKLFLAVCRTVHEHLQILARLAGLLQNDRFRKLLREKAPEAEILKAVRQIEDSLIHAETGSRAETQ